MYTQFLLLYHIPDWSLSTKLIFLCFIILNLCFCNFVIYVYIFIKFTNYFSYVKIVKVLLEKFNSLLGCVSVNYTYTISALMFTYLRNVKFILKIKQPLCFYLAVCRYICSPMCKSNNLSPQTNFHVKNVFLSFQHTGL